MNDRRTFLKTACKPLVLAAMGISVIEACSKEDNENNPIIKDPSSETTKEPIVLDMGNSSFSELKNSGMAFNHLDCATDAFSEVMSISLKSTDALNLIPKEFSISEYQGLLESITGLSLNRANFRKNFLSCDAFFEAKGKARSSHGREGQLYSRVDNFKGGFYPIPLNKMKELI